MGPEQMLSRAQIQQERLDELAQSLGLWDEASQQEFISSVSWVGSLLSSFAAFPD